MINRLLDRFFGWAEGPKNYQKAYDYMIIMILAGLLSWVLGLRGPGNLWWSLATVGSAVGVIHFKRIIAGVFIVLVRTWLAFDIAICACTEALFGKRGRWVADRFMDNFTRQVWGRIIGFFIGVSLIPHRLRERRNKEVPPVVRA